MKILNMNIKSIILFNPYLINLFIIIISYSISICQNIEYGVITIASGLSSNHNFAVANDGTIYIGEIASNNNKIKKRTPDGQISVFSGKTAACANTDGSAANAVYCFTRGIAIDLNGDLITAQGDANLIRRVYPNGTVVTIAGNGINQWLDGIGTNARFKTPWGVAIGDDGNYYISSNGAIRKMTPGGVVTTIAGGNSGSCTGQDGQGTNANICDSSGIIRDPSGVIYFAEHSGAIRKINTTGYVSTIAGLINDQRFADGAATAARFNQPREIAFDRNGNIIISDGDNHAIRLLNMTSMVVSTIAGAGGSQGDVLGEGQQARFNTPISVNVNQTTGNILVSDFNNGKLKMIIPCASGLKWNTTHESCVCTGTGQYVTISGACQLCPLGTYKDPSSHGIESCKACPIGTESSATRTQCNPCAANTYRASLSNSSCIACPTNAVCTATSFACDSGFESDSNANQCVACPVGTAKSTTGNTACSKCPVGQEPALDKKSCVQCQTGTFKPSNTGFNICVNCPLGATCDHQSLTCLAGFTLDSGVAYTCKYCDFGYFKSASGNQACDVCPDGSYSSTSRTACNYCSAGYEVNQLKNGCAQCAGGYIRFDTSSSTNYNCIACQNGTYSNANRTQCHSCDIGFEVNSQKTGCNQCLSGYYRPNTNTTWCLPCPSNAVCTPTDFTCNSGWEKASSGDKCVQKSPTPSPTTALAPPPAPTPDPAPGSGDTDSQNSNVASKSAMSAPIIVVVAIISFFGAVGVGMLIVAARRKRASQQQEQPVANNL